MSNTTEITNLLGKLAPLAMPHLMGKAIVAQKGMAAMSAAADTDFDVAGLALPLLPFQRAGVEFALKARRCYIGDQMGLGKTPQAIAAVVAANTFPALFVVPPSLTINWVREFSKFAPQVSTYRISGNWKKGTTLPTGYDVYIIGDAVVASWADYLAGFGFSAMVVDEAHRAKSKDAKRTKGMQAIARKVDRDGLVLLLSGTAIVNRPSELISQVQILGLMDSVFHGVLAFMDRYYPKTGRNQYEREARNLAELHDIMCDTFYVRRLRNDVLELPGKERVVTSINFDGDAAKAYKAAEKNLREFIRSTKGDAAANRAMRAEALVLLGILRRLSGEAKIAETIEYVEQLVEAGEQVIVFGVHTVVTKTIAAHFGVKPVIGEMKTEEVEVVKERFQNGTDRVIVLNIQKGGVGHTLTAAANVVFAEVDWTPGGMDQAEDRADRIGQTRKVQAHWLLGANGSPTIDEHLFALLNDKAFVVGTVLDGKGEPMVDEDSIMAALLEIYSSEV